MQHAQQESRLRLRLHPAPHPPTHMNMIMDIDMMACMHGKDGGEDGRGARRAMAA